MLRRPLSGPAPLLHSAVRLPDVLFARASLLDDRVIVTGWSFQGRVRREIPLASIEEVSWWTGQPKVNLVLKLKHGEEVNWNTRSAGRWKFAIEQQQQVLGLREGELPDAQRLRIEERTLQAPAPPIPHPAPTLPSHSGDGQAGHEEPALSTVPPLVRGDGIPRDSVQRFAWRLGHHQVTVTLHLPKGDLRFTLTGRGSLSLDTDRPPHVSVHAADDRHVADLMIEEAEGVQRLVMTSTA